MRTLLGMRRVIIALAALVAGLVAVQVGAARPATVLEIKHHFRGCHVFSTNDLPAITARLRKGDRIKLVDHDPMDFEITQTAGPRIPLADPQLRRSEVRLLVFRKVGLYRFRATNVQSSEELGLQTLGPDNTLTIVIRVVA
jgi:hypothetical protein